MDNNLNKAKEYLKSFFFNKKDKKEEPKEKEEINRFLFITTRPVSGGLSMSQPVNSEMEFYIGMLNKIPYINSENSKYFYKPIGVIYEAETKQWQPK